MSGRAIDDGAAGDDGLSAEDENYPSGNGSTLQDLHTARPTWKGDYRTHRFTTHVGRDTGDSKSFWRADI